MHQRHKEHLERVDPVLSIELGQLQSFLRLPDLIAQLAALLHVQQYPGDFGLDVEHPGGVLLHRHGQGKQGYPQEGSRDGDGYPPRHIGLHVQELESMLDDTHWGVTA